MPAPPGPPYPLVNVPFFPATSPWALPYQIFDQLIAARGVELQWAKHHACPCIYAGQIPGSPDSSCVTCGGRGIYWDGFTGAFTGLITFIHTSPTPDEAGTIMDTDQGLIVNGEPALTIPFSQQNGVPWAESSIYDMFVETHSISRFNAQLQVGRNESLPYPQIVSVAPTGAVTTYNTTTSSVVTGAPYVVSGTTVLLTSGLPGQQYMVDFTAAPTYIAYRIAGAPAHIRPFSNINEPRRFRLQTLDLFLRNVKTNGIPVLT